MMANELSGIKQSVGVIGATSMVGKALLPLLTDAGWHVEAFSRKSPMLGWPAYEEADIIFRSLEKNDSDHAACAEAREVITHWICLAPIWVLPDYFPMLVAHRAKRVIALGSTSIFTKKNSPDSAEQGTAEKLRDAEQRLSSWAEANAIEWVILRPTLIYGLGQDRNICEIANFISRFGFFPVFGRAQGLRQPVHVEDVAAACQASLLGVPARNRAYNISGAETLPYKAMVERVFSLMGKPARFVKIPLFAFRAAVACLRVLPRFRHWSPAMAERMNTDLVFDHADAARDLLFSPRPFRPDKVDLPVFSANKTVW